MAEVLIDKTNFVVDGGSGGGNIDAFGQSFTCSINCLVTKAVFKLRTASETGTAYAKLYNHKGTYGTYSIPDVELATSETINLPATNIAYTAFEFNFTTPIAITPGYYVIACFADFSKFFCATEYKPDEKHSGELVKHITTGYWQNDWTSLTETYFELYGEPIERRNFFIFSRV